MRRRGFDRIWFRRGGGLNGIGFGCGGRYRFRRVGCSSFGGCCRLRFQQIGLLSKRRGDFVLRGGGMRGIVVTSRKLGGRWSNRM